jgi:LacI family transcriptional regulator
MRGKVTLQQIADMAGVSKYAVSRALAGKPGVSTHTRELIYKTAGQLGYFNDLSNTPQPQGDSKAVKSAETVAVIFPNIRYQNRESFYWGRIFEGIAQRLDEQRLDMLTLTQPTRDGVTGILNPEGILGIISVGTVSTQVLLDIKRINIPIVMIDHIDPAMYCDSVFMDNQVCIRDLMTHLISKGYRDFQFVGEIGYAVSFNERWQAFRSILENYQIPLNQNPLLNNDNDDNSDYIAKIKSIEINDLPEIFVCANDIIALNVMHALKEMGISVPERCAVTGFDNIKESESAEIPLTTIHVPKELLGARAVDKLLWRLENRNENNEKTLIHGEVVIRASTQR